MPRSSGKTVLVVDDDPELRRLVTGVLERKGHAVVRAPDGVWALRALDEQPIDLVIMDILMPRKDGLETLREMRDGRHQELPVILVTAESRDADLIRGYDAGADYYLTKPFKPSQLLKMVDFLIGDLSEGQRRKLGEEL